MLAGWVGVSTWREMVGDSLWISKDFQWIWGMFLYTDSKFLIHGHACEEKVILIRMGAQFFGGKRERILSQERHVL